MQTRDKHLNIRGVYGVVLLLLLAVCGYAGSYEPVSKVVSIPVIRTEYAMPTEKDDFIADILCERKQESSLLQKVVDHEYTDQETRQESLKQITENAKNAEIESDVTALLEGIGYFQSACVNNAHGLTILLKEEYISGQERVRLIDAVGSLASCSPGNIKIILTKK